MSRSRHTNITNAQTIFLYQPLLILLAGYTHGDIISSVSVVFFLKKLQNNEKSGL